MTRSILVLLTTLLLSPALDTTRSTPRKGPGALSGWTINDTDPDHGSEYFPVKLVIARKGRIIRKISGDPFVWQWMFLADGKRIAYQSGPFHFSLQCVLADVDSGKTLQSYDCFHEPLAGDAPGWVKDLKQVDVDWNK